MKTVDALSDFLIATRQIDALALRQARLLSRPVTDHDTRDKAAAILLLALVALRNGSPRTDRTSLCAPLEPGFLSRMAETVRTVENSTPAWHAPLSRSLPLFTAIIDELIDNPFLFAPVSGVPPASANDPWPLLVIGPSGIGFSRLWKAVFILENDLIPNLLQEVHPLPEESTVNRALRRVFSERSLFYSGNKFDFRQIAAAALACTTRFLIVSGGPGTGKTSVVIQILRTLLAAYPELAADRIALCAPTGRAKARLSDACSGALDTLNQRYPDSDEASAFRDRTLRLVQARTLHSLLGMHPDGRCRYNRISRLPHQVIVVDEASMVDLVLFVSLLEAMNDSCRLILVGDMHQLPSVDAGTILGDLTEGFSDTGTAATLSTAHSRWITGAIGSIPSSDPFDPVKLDISNETGAPVPLVDHVIILTRSYRSERAILDLADAVNTGNADRALSLLNDKQNRGSVSIDVSDQISGINTWFAACFSSESTTIAYRDLGRAGIADIDERQVRAIHELLYQSVLLTFTHDGPRGRRAINAHADRMLRNLLGNTAAGRFYHGLPVILGANHPDLDLYNGDMGIVLHFSREGTRVLFPRGNGYRLAALDRLSNLEPAFALTVHKAQGSEFDRVLLLLPEHESPLLNRQIIYTAITRAKKHVKIIGRPELLKRAIATLEIRTGGVRI